MSSKTQGAMREIAGDEVALSRRDVVRLLPEAPGLRAADAAATEPSDGRTMFGHFSVFNTWTEINSIWEGKFMEQVAPGAYRKTFKENRATMRVLTEHGGDPQLGNRALGPIEVLREDDIGAYYEVPLVDATDVNELVLPRLRAGLYGASFRFQVMREEIVDEPAPSDSNPHGLPERTIKEARVMEFGPVTFPAYAEATAGVRSLTDEVVPAAKLAVARSTVIAELVALLRADEPDEQLLAALAGGGWMRAEEPAQVVQNGDEAGGDDAPDPVPTTIHTVPAAPEPSKATTPLYGATKKEAWRL